MWNIPLFLPKSYEVAIIVFSEKKLAKVEEI
jgi:hypothetical protein